MDGNRWTDEKSLTLIRAVRDRPILWDPKDPCYYKKTMKPAAWHAVSQEVGFSAKSCKHKMMVLMSSFRREKCRIVHSLREKNESPDPSSYRTYKSGWFAFKEMAFLLTRRKKIREEVEDIDPMSILDHYVEPRILEPAQASKRKRSDTDSETSNHGLNKSIKTEALSENSDYFDYEESDIDETELETDPIPEQPKAQPIFAEVIRRNNDDDDEVRSFANFIASKMKKYSERTKNSVQEAICEIIFKADKGDILKD